MDMTVLGYLCGVSVRFGLCDPERSLGDHDRSRPPYLEALKISRDLDLVPDDTRHLKDLQ